MLNRSELHGFTSFAEERRHIEIGPSAVMTMNEPAILADAQRVANAAWSQQFRKQFKAPAGFSPDALP